MPDHTAMLDELRRDYRDVGLFADNEAWTAALDTLPPGHLEELAEEWADAAEDAELDGRDRDDPEVHRHLRQDLLGWLAGLRVTRTDIPEIVVQVNRRLATERLVLTVDPNDYSPTRVRRLLLTGAAAPVTLDWRSSLMDGFVDGVNVVLARAGAPRRFISLDTQADYRIYAYGDADLERRLRASPRFLVDDAHYDHDAGLA